MFIVDRPIETSDEDKLSRRNYSIRLAETILQWKATNSLVIALFGKWGSGKSSIINLAKSHLTSIQDKRITIIEFNPWLFSGEEKLTEHFFNELAKDLELQNSSEKDIALAKKFRLYSNLFKLFTDKEQVAGIVKQLLIVLGVLGITLNQFLLSLDIDLGKAKILLYILGLIFLLLSFIRGVVEKIADIFESKSNSAKKTVQSFKKEINDALKTRENKLLIVIDDIDRLTPNEIRQIFKLVKINTDFPNIIFLLSFDREIVEKALQEQEGISGSEYLEKIVQVNFDVPAASQEKISAIFVEECNKVLATLPKAADTLLDKHYWGNIYQSGLKNFFRNVRDVKRFVSSLEFSFSLLHKGQSIEVNPVDFIAIEAIRIFAPDFYHFLKKQKQLFTTSSEELAKRMKEDIEKALTTVPKYLSTDMKDLISRLFPTIGKVLLKPGERPFGYSTGPDAMRYLRVSSASFFDTYFNFIPGGDENEISQFELEQVMAEFNNGEILTQTFKDYDRSEKLLKLLDRLQYYTDDETLIPDHTIPNFINACFEIADFINNRYDFWFFGVHGLWAAIISKLLYRKNTPDTNAELLKKSILNSQGLYGYVYYIKWISKREKNIEDLERILPSNYINEMQKACVVKLEEYANDGRLIENKHFLELLFIWREWSVPTDSTSFISHIVQENRSLLQFLNHFVSTTTIQSFSDVVSQQRTYFNYKSLQELYSINEIRERVREIPTEELGAYSATVHLFLSGDISQQRDFE